VVREKDDIQQAMQFLQECDLIKIEDILPFFSDFVTIDHFKDAICTSLQVTSGARVSVVAWNTILQAGRSQV
jgi:hypothetical protein